MGWFVYRAFKALRDEKAAGIQHPIPSPMQAQEETVTR
jgi:hypothetical protein